MSFLGDLIAATGNKLGLGEMGISEKFGSNGEQWRTNAPVVANTVNNTANRVAQAVQPAPTQLQTAAPNAPAAPAADPNATGGPAFSYDPAAVAAAAAAAENAQKIARLKGEGAGTLDQLYALYDQIIGEIKRVGGDQANRINKDFDGKVQDQTVAMNEGMYDTDVAAAASNLADSSWRSFDRSKVRTAADANKKTLNTAREQSLGEVGAMVAGDTAKYEADKAGIGRTRELLQGSTDLNEVQTTANTLDATKRGVEADKAKYNTTGEFAQKANKVGNYDTSTIEATLATVVQNASASPATKQAAINDLLGNAPIEEGEKERLKNKYTQTV